MVLYNTAYIEEKKISSASIGFILNIDRKIYENPVAFNIP